MTKGERRAARKAARQDGVRLTGELAIYAEHGPAVEWSETPRGYDARERWARRHDDLNGAPEGDWDR